jgi:hypothetical protein
MFASNPAFQAAMVLALFLIAYTLHVRYLPFLSALPTAPARAPSDEVDPAAETAAAAAGGGIAQRRKSVVVAVAAAAAAADAAKREVLRQIMDLNVLEGTMLRCSVFVLLGGLAFASGAFGDEDSVGSTILATIVGALVTGASALFIAMVVLETREMVRTSRVAAVKLAAPVLSQQHLVLIEELLQSGGAPASGVMVNPVYKRRSERSDALRAVAAVSAPLGVGAAGAAR